MSKQIQIITAVGSSMKIEDVMNKTGFGKATIIGCLAQMKKEGTVTYEDGVLTVTEKGKEYLPKQQVKAVDQVAKKRGRQPDPNSKRAKADILLAANPNMRHEDKVTMLMEKAGCTMQGANTYIYNFGVKMKAQKAQ